jgi:ATPase family associated with various cellular activities (AAA)
MHNLHHTYATTSAQIRVAIDSHQEWIEHHLEVPLNQALILDSEGEVYKDAIARVLGYADPEARIETCTSRLMQEVTSAEVPEDHVPIIELRKERASNAQSSLATASETTFAYSIEWTDGPVVLRTRSLSFPIVTVAICLRAGPDSRSESRKRLLVIPKSGLQEYVSFIKFLMRPEPEAKLRVWNGESRTIAPCLLDDLVLDPEITRLVARDFEFFWGHEEHFRRLRLPFRRGYLFHGPPGNGKSSMARYLQTSRCLPAYTIRFLDNTTDDADLDQMFQYAGENAPAIILLEDIDRIFPKGGTSKTHVSLQQLLNCLDGIGSAEGIVTIATANDPTALDPAILKRPGRFDRVVLFANPKPELRHRYFTKMMPGLDSRELAAAVLEADGFSFAQLRECFIMAMQTALMDARDVNGEDLIDAIATVRNAVLFGSLRTSSPGFGMPTKK